LLHATTRPVASFRTTLLALALALPVGAHAQAVQPEFLYKLSSLTGVLPFQGMNVLHDAYHDETLVVGEGRVRVFNSSGMEIFSFGEDPALGGVSAAAPLEDGDYLLLTFREGSPVVLRANFRGEMRARIELKGIPADISEGLTFNAIGFAKDRIYLANTGSMRVLLFDMDGNFVAHRDVATLLDLADKRNDYGMRGFHVTVEGDVLFTVPTLFQAYVLSPEGTLRSFGIKGSAPGKFNVISSIARDERGYYYVTDILKSAVLVFDKDFRWLKEFGYRGGRPGSLASPVDVAAGGGKVYVSQYARRGVSVFKVTIGDSP
jgi:hypothetical protein